MAEKKSNKKLIKKSTVKKAVKTVKKNKGLSIAVAVVVFLIIIAIVVMFVLKPELLTAILSLILNEGKDNSIPGITQLTGNYLEVKILNIGQGDCIFISFPDGKNMIMDIGSEFKTTSPWNVINSELESRNISTIDYLFLSHSDYDHIREAKKLTEIYEIKNYYIPKVNNDVSATWGSFVTVMNQETYGNNIKSTISYNVGTYTITGEGWSMRCISYDEADYPDVKSSSSAEIKNSVSPICFLTYSNRTIVLTGDANERNEKYLLEKEYLNGYDADVLKVAHHGSKTSTSNEFLQKVDCEYAVISASATNEYGHPTPELLERLSAYKDTKVDDDYKGFKQIYRTDIDGTVTVQVGNTGIINLISEKDDSKNLTDKRVEISNVSVIITSDYIVMRRYIFV